LPSQQIFGYTVKYACHPPGNYYFLNDILAFCARISPQSHQGTKAHEVFLGTFSGVFDFLWKIFPFSDSG
jgi:hypothetical protein